MKKYLNAIKKCSLFENISEENILSVLGCIGAKIESFDKKYTIFIEGSKAKYIGVVLSGSVQISQFDYYGNRSILGKVRSGEMFAEAFACADVKYLPVSVITDEPSEIMLVDCSRILCTCQKACAFHNQLVFNLMKNLAIKNLMLYQRVEITSKRKTREKLLAYLMFYSKKTGQSSFDIPFDRQELADYLEVDRSGLSAEISKLRNEGILKSNKKHFELL